MDPKSLRSCLWCLFEPQGLKKEAPGVSSKIGPIWGPFWDPQKWRKHYKQQQKSTFKRYPKVSLLGSILGAFWEPEAPLCTFWGAWGRFSADKRGSQKTLIFRCLCFRPRSRKLSNDTCAWTPNKVFCKSLLWKSATGNWARQV